MTTTTIPLPSGAVAADDWELQTDGSSARVFRGTGRGTHPRVGLCGMQAHSGAVLRHVAWLDAGRYGAELAAADGGTERALSRFNPIRA